MMDLSPLFKDAYDVLTNPLTTGASGAAATWALAQIRDWRKAKLEERKGVSDVVIAGRKQDEDEREAAFDRLKEVVDLLREEVKGIKAELTTEKEARKMAEKEAAAARREVHELRITLARIDASARLTAKGIQIPSPSSP